MKQIIKQLEAIKRDIATTTKPSPASLLKKAALAYSLLNVFYSHNSLENFGPGEFQKKSLGKMEQLIHNSDQIIDVKGIDFLKSELLTLLSLLIVMADSDSESIEDNGLGMTG